MKLKSTLFAGLLAASLAVPAFANDASVVDTPLPQFTAADTQMLFEQDAAPMQLAALSPQEMKETEGAVFWFLPVVAWTLFGGTAGVGINRWTTGSWTGWGRAFGSGATAGFWNSPIVRPFGAVTTYTMGGLGAASWYRSWK